MPSKKYVESMNFLKTWNLYRCLYYSYRFALSDYFIIRTFLEFTSVTGKSELYWNFTIWGVGVYVLWIVFVSKFILIYWLLFFTVLTAITRCVSQTIQITPNEKEPVREEHSKYGVTCYGLNLFEFQWRGPSGIISQSQQFRWVFRRKTNINYLIPAKQYYHIA